MSIQSYLIDTNIIIGLEDNHAVKPPFSAFHSLTAKHKVDVFVHEAVKDDLAQDRDKTRREVSLSKIEKFQVLPKVRDLRKADLCKEFGDIRKHNDLVDATLLHSLRIGVVDFLVTQDNGLHIRARRHSFELGRRVLYIADAVELLTTTFEPKESPIRYVEEVQSHTISLKDTIFDSLREDYPQFDSWWMEKCVRERRKCWVVFDDQVAGLIVRKNENAGNTDSTLHAEKILKICTFKVQPENRGIKLGELLLKKVFWFAQQNAYDLVYLTTYKEQTALIDLLEYFGFIHTTSKDDGELVYEKQFSSTKLEEREGESIYLTDRLNYPRFISGPMVRAFGVPIKEAYHDVLYPDLVNKMQGDLFDGRLGDEQSRPGNTIRKVYLCRAKSNLGSSGSILFFYKGKAVHPPSQALTSIGILEEVALAKSTTDLVRLTGGRSVYSERDLTKWNATERSPVKVINYLLMGYISPPVNIEELYELGIFKGHPPQSIFEISAHLLPNLLEKFNLGYTL